jgi:cytochrome P450
MARAQKIGLVELVVGIIALVGSYAIYNIFFHPLRQYPGPWYTKSSRLWFIVKVFRGTVVYDIKQLHDKYGDIVRVAPNELSYTNPDAWQEVYGRNNRDVGKLAIFKKDPTFYSGVFAEANFYADIEGEPYKKQKKALLGGMTRKANLLQEDVLLETAGRLIGSLQSSTVSEPTFDIHPYLQNAAMDIMMRLIIGLDLQAIHSGDVPHPTTVTTDRAFRLSILYLQFRRLSSLITDPLENLVGKLTLRFGMLDYMDFVTPLVQDRLKSSNPRPDFVSYMLPYLTTEEITKNAIMLTLAGSESTVSVLSSTLYFMLTKPKTFLLAQQEVRNLFHKASDITIEGSEQLVYLQACITEAIRLFPPFWGAAPREVPAGGAVICGKYVPAKSTVSVYHWAMYQTERNFHDASEFKPERWLGDKNEIESKAYNPFSFGPRICIGKEISLLVTRLTLAHLIWAYDFELSTESIGTGWEKPPAYMAPTRHPLFIKLRARN